MDPTTEKVFQRLNYERLLYTTDLQPRRMRITLEELLHAAKAEPRVYEVLPGLIILKPTVIAKLKQDLPRYPDLKKVTDTLFREKGLPRSMRGIPTADCLKAAIAFKNYLEGRKTKQNSRTITLRLSPNDYRQLTDLSRKKGIGYSQVIRELIHKTPA